MQEGKPNRSNPPSLAVGNSTIFNVTGWRDGPAARCSYHTNLLISIYCPESMGTRVGPYSDTQTYMQTQ